MKNNDEIKHTCDDLVALAQMWANAEFGKANNDNVFEESTEFDQNNLLKNEHNVSTLLQAVKLGFTKEVIIAIFAHVTAKAYYAIVTSQFEQTDGEEVYIQYHPINVDINFAELIDSTTQ